MRDLISRQAAIDAMNTRLEDIKLTWREKVKKGEIAMYLDMRGVIETLPSVQPEIIRCKDCIYYRWEIDMCDYPYATAHNVVHEDDYCSKAERRTDG